MSTARGPLRLWLLGMGIAASPSPAMHNAALRAVGLEGEYTLAECDAAGLTVAIDRLRAGAAQGANVTIPHKRAAAAACDLLEGDARLLGAVNTLVAENGRVMGTNSDAAGLEAALREVSLWPQGGAAIVVGAGGAAAAALLALARAGCAPLHVAARRLDRASATARSLEAVAEVTPVAVADAGPLLAAAGVVVNATPTGLVALALDVTRLSPAVILVDLRYRPRPVDTVAAARASGRRGTDGLGMLLHQGMLSFARWTGRTPPLEAARDALLEAVGAAR